ncbi:hypothetical protein SEA_ROSAASANTEWAA_45 [Streptomyces phage RosaAsantewaa]|nr:hypothetical protein SEA_ROSAASANTEWAA_45 [Streptomyces phage RosaAsantewaa]
MNDVWNFYIANWLLVFYIIIGSALAAIGVTKVIDTVIERAKRRRYRKART